MDFNKAPSIVMHVDINSCFATIEQQANPFLRYKPVAVAAYTSESGCILAASYEAKAKGVKTGMRVKDGKLFCPNLIVLSPDPNKYRFVHRALEKILKSYSNSVVPKSIDEFVVDFKGLPILKLKTMSQIGFEIKERIKSEIGEYITVSIGISTNRFLAKTAASYKKPDGLFEINKENYIEVFKSLSLTDLCGIKRRNARRLLEVGICDVISLYNSSLQTLKSGFRSINGHYWYLKLRGYEVDKFENTRKTFGNSYSLPKPYEKFEDLSPILTKLIEKMARRLRRKNYMTSGVHIGILFRNRSYWHKGIKLTYPIYITNDIKDKIFKLFLDCPNLTPVRNLSVSCFNLEKKRNTQLNLMEDVLKKESLTGALDNINNKYGDFTIIPARMINSENYVIDRIAFGIIDSS